MSTMIDERVSVNLLSSHLRHTVMPTSLSWRGRQYRIIKVGLHHTIQEGKTLCHIFSVTDGNSFFKLQFNTQSLNWKLLEINDNTV